MSAKLDESERFNMIAPASWLKKVDLWRRQQDDVPNRSEAIRRLVEMSLEGEKKGHKRGRA